ncbi:uncharacterized protein LOC129600345 [Paramacrobiotus metropolitanus]|uniref:uncharacterized protein LOC129600345 n=1 Tax=Paramacrobiotus metropolitanus TaxID=2943436 RepID=UPI0024461DBE|nr:uncharacterized protein LOC129600345 [Paramacrobiotus metropolitanus]
MLHKMNTSFLRRGTISTTISECLYCIAVLFRKYGAVRISLCQPVPVGYLPATIIASTPQPRQKMLPSKLLPLSMLLAFAAHVGAENCEEIREACDTIRHSIPDDDIRDLPWPATEADYAPHRALSDKFCSTTNRTGHCLRDIVARCPDDPYMLQRGTIYSHYSIESVLATAKLCEHYGDSLRYRRAMTYCKSRARQYFRVLTDGTEQRARSSKKSNARANMCESARLFSERLTGTTKDSLVEACGQETVNVMLDGTRTLHAAYC